MTTTPCIRCGKMRIVEKTWTDNVGESSITYTRTVCPDPECQKEVDEMLETKRLRIENIQKESLKRRANVRRGKSGQAPEESEKDKE